MTTKKETYVDYCKDFAITQLTDMKGYESHSYGCDLVYKLTEGINVDGSATYSTFEAKEYIKEWWDEASEVYEYQKDNYGECLHNPFEEPEAFHVCMIIEGVNSLLANCNTVEENWNEDLELIDEVIEQIIKEIKEISEIRF